MVTKQPIVYERGGSQGTNSVARMVQACTFELLKPYLPPTKTFRVATRRNANLQMEMLE